MVKSSIRVKRVSTSFANEKDTDRMLREVS